MKVLKRTDMCAELSLEDLSREVVLNGWVSKMRDQGGLVFVDLRDKTGIVQLLFDDTLDKELLEKSKSLKSEYVIGVAGTVEERQSNNPELPTGEIEIRVSELTVYSEA